MTIVKPPATFKSVKARKFRKRFIVNPPEGYFLIKEGKLRKGDMLAFKGNLKYNMSWGNCSVTLGMRLDRKSDYVYARPKGLRGFYSNFLDWCERKFWTA